MILFPERPSCRTSICSGRSKPCREKIFATTLTPPKRHSRTPPPHEQLRDENLAENRSPWRIGDRVLGSCQSNAFRNSPRSAARRHSSRGWLQYQREQGSLAFNGPFRCSRRRKAVPVPQVLFRPCGVGYSSSSNPAESLPLHIPRSWLCATQTLPHSQGL